MEFKFEPHYCQDCIFRYAGFVWCDVSFESDKKTLHKISFPVQIGSTFHSRQLIPYMEQLVQMYMSTTRGLTA